LQGRWTIAEVNGQPATGLWLDLGGEGVGTVTRLSDGGIAFGSPEPRTSAYLGCNTFHPNGWTRNGDKMMLATEGALMTERGCDPSRLATETRAREILGKPMTMELIPPDRLRLINEAGALELVRQHGGR
jgi:heat shock protein HslJ